jgi:hypothetical protein
MIIPQKLKRLHSIRSAEEQQMEILMNAELVELRRLQNALETTRERLRRARTLLATSAQSGPVEDRLAGLEEIILSNRLASLLAIRIGTAEQRFLQSRSQFLSKRIERRQVGSLLEEARRQVRIDEARNAQHALDDWARSKTLTGRGRRK